MDFLTTILQMLLALLGADAGSGTYSHRATDGGVDTLHSIAVVEAGIAHFECLASASGECVYTVVPAPCAGKPSLAGLRLSSCGPSAPRRFSLPAGATRDIAGLRVDRLCVATGTASPAPDCGMPAPVAPDAALRLAATP